MYKQIIGVGLLVVLFGVVLYNQFGSNFFTDEEEVQSNSEEGVGIIPPNMAGIEEGEVAPDFELETLSGEKAKLSDFRGKKVFLNFWASWCGPCKEEMPDMQTFYDQYQDEVEIVAVNLTGKENNEDDAIEFVEAYQYTYPILLDRELKAGTLYSVVAIPTTYFINSEGVVAAQRKTGPMTYDMMIDMMNEIDE